MKLHYWGTGAAEGIPSTFCNCKVCQEAREKGGRYVRGRSQVMIDDELLVDFGADTYQSSLKAGYNLSQLGDVLITHTHEDHYYPQELHNRQKGFCYDLKYQALTLHGSSSIVEKYYDYMAGNGQYLIDQGRVALSVMKPYEKYKIGNFEVIPLPATHGTVSPFVYVISKNGKTIFYLNDSGVLKQPVVDWLAESGIKFDLVSYDCTMGMQDTYNDWGENASHMGLPSVIMMREKLKAAGVYKDDTVDIVTHFSHNGPKVGYGDFKPLAEDAGFILAYDGFKIEV